MHRADGEDLQNLREDGTKNLQQVGTINILVGKKMTTKNTSAAPAIENLLMRKQVLCAETKWRIHKTVRANEVTFHFTKEIRGNIRFLFRTT